MTRISLALLILWTSVTVCAQPVVAPPVQEGIRQHAVLIIPFRMLGNDEKFAWVGQAIQENLQAELARSSLLRMVTSVPARPAPVAGATDEQAWLQAASNAQATVLVMGSYQVADQEIRVTGKILDVASGQLIGALRASGTERQILDVEDAIAEQAKQVLGITPVAALQPLTDQPEPRAPVSQGAPAEPPAEASRTPYDTDYAASAEEPAAVYDPSPAYSSTYYPSYYRYYPQYSPVYVYPAPAYVSYPYSYGYSYPYRRYYSYRSYPYSFYPYTYSYCDDFFFLSPRIYYPSSSFFFSFSFGSQYPYYGHSYPYYGRYPYYGSYYHGDGRYNQFAHDRFNDHRSDGWDHRGPRFRDSMNTTGALVVREPGRVDRSASFGSASFAAERTRSDTLAFRTSEPRRGEVTVRSLEPVRPDRVAGTSVGRDGTRTTTIRSRDVDPTRSRDVDTSRSREVTRSREADPRSDRGVVVPRQARDSEPARPTRDRAESRSGEATPDPAPRSSPRRTVERGDAAAAASSDASDSSSSSGRREGASARPDRSDSGGSADRPRGGSDAGSSRSRDAAPARGDAAPSRSAPSRSDGGTGSSRGSDSGMRSAPPSRGFDAPSRGSAGPSRSSASPGRSGGGGGGGAPSRGGGGGGGARGGGGGGGGRR
jgi:TolB-like protein